MSANTTAEINAPSRPPVVDYAVYALIARSAFSLGAAFALYGARNEVTRTLADANKDKHWSATTLHDKVDAALRANLLTTLVMIVLVAIIARFVWSGRSWARWLYLFFAILITRDIFQVFGFFQYDDFLTRVLTGLVGLSSIAALALLFLPDSNAFFRPAGGGGGLLGSMLGARGMGAAARPGTSAGAAGRPRQSIFGGRPATPPTPAQPVEQPDAAGASSSSSPSSPSSSFLSSTPESSTSTPSTPGSSASGSLEQAVDQPSAGRQQPPRGKSRQSGQPKRNDLR
jgi:hypothetical protein